MFSSEKILELISSDKPDEIREGCRLAGDAGLMEALPALVKQISSANIGVQEAVDRALRKIGGPEVVKAVIPLLRSEDAPERNIAMDLLRHHGGTHVEVVIDLLHDDDSDVRIFASDILGSVDNLAAIPALGRSLLSDPEVNVRYQAAVSLGNLGSPSAASFLAKAINDEEWVQFSVIEALTKIRDEASVSALVTALERSSDLISSTIIDALGEMGNIKAVPLLLKKLESSPAALCNKIIRAIINILGDSSLSLLGGKKSKHLCAYMEAAILDEDFEVQDAAVKGLAFLGSNNATRLIIDLASGLNPDVDTERLSFLVDAAVRIGYNDELEKAFVTSSNKSVCAVAIEVLGRVDDPRVVPLLKSQFKDSPTDLQRTIIRFLSQKADKAEEEFFLSVLREQQDGKILRSALYFIGNNGNPEKVDEEIIKLLAHPYNDVKEGAMEACIELGTEKIHKHFEKMTESYEDIDRLMAVYALGSMDFDRNIESLKKSLEDPEALIRKAAVEVIGKQDAATGKYISLIECASHDASSEVRMAAVDVLGTSSDPEVEDILIEKTDDDDYWVKVRCVEHLGNRRSAKAGNHLVNLLSSENSLVVISAVNALAKIGGEIAFRSILTVIDHPEHEIQAAAEEALANLSKQTEV